MNARNEILKALAKLEEAVRQLVLALEAGDLKQAGHQVVSFEAWLLTVRKLVEL